MEANSNACMLCCQVKALHLSHIIPNAVFRRIKQDQNSGQLISMDDSDDAPIRRSQQTWSEYLLCTQCEQLIGGYESYGLELLRAQGSRTSPEYRAEGVAFHGYEFRSFKLFLTSILWRAAVARQDAFSKVVLPDRCREEARVSLLMGKPLASLRLGCRLHRLVDTTAAEGGFNPQSLRQLVISPIPRLREGRNFYSFLFVIEGFLLEYFVRAVPFKRAGLRGVVRDAPLLFVPNKCIFDVPEIVQILVTAFGKHQRGLIAS